MGIPFWMRKGDQNETQEPGRRHQGHPDTLRQVLGPGQRYHIVGVVEARLQTLETFRHPQGVGAPQVASDTEAQRCFAHGSGPEQAMKPNCG